jgi:hypothetical protein
LNPLPGTKDATSTGWSRKSAYVRGLSAIGCLGDQTELALDEALRAEEYDVPDAVPTLTSLRDALAEFGVSGPPTIKHNGIKLTVELDTTGVTTTDQIARLLASGYLLGDVDSRVFPYIRGALS